MHSSSSSVLVAGTIFCIMLGALSTYDPPKHTAALPRASVAPAADLTGSLTVRKDVREVAVGFTVTDEDGIPVTDLRPEQIRVYSDESAVSALSAFYRTSDLPLRFFVLVDTSDSVTPTFLAELKATDLFAARLVRPRIDQIAWAGFASRVDTYQASQPALRPATFGRNAIGQTALYDAVYEIAKQEKARLPDSRLTRKALLVLSDGEDNWSRRSLDEAIESAREADFTIFCLTAHDQHSDYAGDVPLRKLAAATGGRAFILSSYDHLDGVFEQIEKQLRSQYLLTFVPPSEACGTHSMKVVPADRAYEVKSRSDYYVDGCR